MKWYDWKPEDKHWCYGFATAAVVYTTITVTYLLLDYFINHRVF